MSELLWFGAGVGGAYLWLRYTHRLRPSPAPDAPADPGSSTQLTKSTPTGDAAPTPPPIAPQLTGRWVWPVPRWQGRAPVISDGYGSPRGGAKHQGVDVMFAKLATDPYPLGANATKSYVMPESWMAIAASDGVLWSADKSERGWQVVIDHGPGSVATYYQHLSALYVPTTKPPAKGTPRAQMPQIKAGQPLGVIGADPLDKGGVKHLHFEVWTAGPSSAIDPAQLMKSWEVVGSTDLGQLVARNLRNISKREAAILENREKYGDLVPVEEHLRRWPGTAHG